ncbi:MAG: hypothetical protein R3F05_00100 [Planctomycetota bacterium]
MRRAWAIVVGLAVGGGVIASLVAGRSVTAGRLDPQARVHPDTAAWPELRGTAGPSSSDRLTVPSEATTHEAPPRGAVEITLTAHESPRHAVLLVVGPGEYHVQRRTLTTTQPVSLEDVPYDGSVRVGLLFPCTSPTGPVLHRVRGPTMHLDTSSDALPVTLRAVDVTSGADVAGVRAGSRHAPLPTVHRLRTSGSPERVGLPRLFLPSGWAALPERHECEVCPLSVRARHVRVDVVLAPEADVVVRADARGTLGFGDMRVLAGEVGGHRIYDVTTERLGPTAVRLRGLPWMQDEVVRALVCAGDARPFPPGESECGGCLESLDAGKLAASVDAWVGDPDEFLDDEPARTAIARGRIQGPPGAPVVVTASFGRSEPIEECFDDDLPWEVSFSQTSTRAMPHPTPGKLTVLVMDRQGQPLPWVRVHALGASYVANAQGRCRIEPERPGEVRVTLEEPGFVRTEARAMVAAGTDSHLELHESNGGAIDVRVRGSEGLLMAGADIAVPDEAGWADVDDEGTQRLDIRTDHRGTRLLQRFPAGTWTLSVVYGSRTAAVAVTVIDGETTTLDVVLPPVPEPPAGTED